MQGSMQVDLFGQLAAAPSAARPPRDPMLKAVWDAARQMFAGVGYPDAKWRPVIGQWISKFGPANVLAVCEAGLREGPIDPIAWGRAALKARSGEDESGMTAEERYLHQLCSRDN
jgi:hypothetical protein